MILRQLTLDLAPVPEPPAPVPKAVPFAEYERTTRREAISRGMKRLNENRRQQKADLITPLHHYARLRD